MSQIDTDADDPQAPLPNPSDLHAGLLDVAAVDAALQLLSPLLDSVLRPSQINGSGVLYFVVMDPSRDPTQTEFEAAILCERSFGKSGPEWDADYRAFARDKARLSWRHRCDSHLLQTLSPQRLTSADSRLWGSVCLDGLVVAVSGCELAYDEALSGCLALLLRAALKHARR